MRESLHSNPHDMPTRLAYKGCFRALDDSGLSDLIDVYQLMHESLQGRHPALTLFRTTDGETVRRKGKGEYEIAGTGTSLHAIDPNCP